MATKRSTRRSANRSHMRVVRPDERVAEAAQSPVADVPASDAAPESDNPAPPTADGEMSLADAVAGGNYQEILQAQSRDIIRDLAAATGASKAALHGRLMTISKEIESLKSAPGGEKSVVATTDDETWDPEAI
ncbi:hypothetical protein [Mycobacteroides abscessus]|uniref:hypothetical protein n=2 Tax=Mycobacteroides abscessus TaxID=36809 RepID=UPI0009C98AF1|nr:hypothetical protein [Mycobacteroides abscessus]MDB2211820.1 hypothetical protein [Mycobacteroides abscessus subsp. massiliense]MDB2235330.1 hypothetical protein [Mycobacteroides abscessus subsp. massiliense]WJJ56047.1 hypothetical protein PROPHIT362B_23 [Mycobacterium phage prophiT36-2b]SKO29239.1 Uncharacterised protein [Mycobacteroides abscessus subsp. massiliense]